MSINPLPPQAYTKDTVSKAFQWLLTQPPHIKELASSQDVLISLYLKACRDGQLSLESPSIQNFKNELKTIANMMGEFSQPSTAVTSSSTQPSPTSFASHPSAVTTASSTSQTMSSSTTGGQTPAMTKPIAPTALNTTQIEAAESQLDEKSLLLVRYTKENLNLSSDAEALRVLIKIGYTQVKTMLNI